MKRLFYLVSIVFFSSMIFCSTAFGAPQSDVIRSIRLSTLSGIWFTLLRLDGIEFFIIPALIAFIYFIIWINFIRDKSSKVIAPVFSPPGDIDPGSVRYAMQRRLDVSCFEANLINLAVKGYILVNHEPASSGIDKISYISRTNKIISDDLSAAEASLLKKVFYYENEVLISEDSFFLSEEFAESEINMRKYGERVFSLNREYWITGITFLLLFPILGYIYYAPMRLVISIALIVYIYYSKLDRIIKKFCLLLSFSIRRLLWAVLSSRYIYPITRIFYRFILRILFWQLGAITLFSLIFSQNWIFQDSEFLLCLSTAGFLTYSLFLFFRRIFPIYTEEGRKLIVSAEGLRIYMTTDRPRLEYLNPPADSPSVFEKLLPWAIAFGITEKWDNRFHDVIEKAKYSPAWYFEGKNRDILLYGNSANKLNLKTKSTSY